MRPLILIFLSVALSSCRSVDNQVHAGETVSGFASPRFGISSDRSPVRMVLFGAKKTPVNAVDLASIRAAVAEMDAARREILSSQNQNQKP